MLKSSSLFKTITEQMGIIWTKRKERKAVQDFLMEKFNYPYVEYSEYVLGVREIAELEEEKIYWLVCGINYIHKDKIETGKYFSDLEIRKYSNMKYTLKKIEKYPYIIEDVKEVADDQWVCVMNIDTLKDLYNKQLIVYNPNTQRELKKNIKDGMVYYTINVNNQSVKEIEEALLSGEFIPNDLSFNMSLNNPEIDFDIIDGNFVLRNGQFDIIDGFHRFKGALRAKQADPAINFNFIINIMNFDESKACTFIAQEDKRNKISATFSKSLDSKNPTKMIVDRINTSPNSLIRGLVGKEGTNVVNMTDLFGYIDELYKTNKMNRTQILMTANHIIEVINMCVDNDPGLLESFGVVELGIIICGTTLGKDAFECYQKICKVMPNKYNLVKTINRPTKRSINILLNLFA